MVRLLSPENAGRILISKQGLNESEIARACGCARSTVQDYVERARAVGLTLAQISGVPDSEVLLALGKRRHREQSVKGPSVDWAWVSTELRRPGVTLALLWAEKVEGQAGKFSYSSFCRRFRTWEGKHEVTLRQVRARINFVTWAQVLRQVVFVSVAIF